MLFSTSFTANLSVKVTMFGLSSAFTEIGNIIISVNVAIISNSDNKPFLFFVWNIITKIIINATIIIAIHNKILVLSPVPTCFVSDLFSTLLLLFTKSPLLFPFDGLSIFVLFSFDGLSLLSPFDGLSSFALLSSLPDPLLVVFSFM